MRRLLAIALSVGVLPVIAWQQSGIVTGSARGPVFSDFPAPESYSGPIARPKFQTKADEKYLGSALKTLTARPNFAGQFRIVSFRMGDGPTGAFLFDAKTGTISRLPSNVVREDFFIYDTDCLGLYRKWQDASTAEQDDSVPFSFNASSELLIVRRCVVAKTSVAEVERSYYRWHGRKWHLLRRVSLPPPPPLPVP
jgi:hypothetical protein